MVAFAFYSFTVNRHWYIDFLFFDGIRLGNYDIKQSLSMKRRQDRTEALQLPDETDPYALLRLGQREYKNGNTEIAVLFISKAILTSIY